MAEPNRGRPPHPYQDQSWSGSTPQEDQEARAYATPGSHPDASAHMQHASQQSQYVDQPPQGNLAYGQQWPNSAYVGQYPNQVGLVAGYNQGFVAGYPQGSVEYTEWASGYNLRQPSPAETYLSEQQNFTASFQSHNASSYHPVASEAGGYAATVTPQQPSSLNRTVENWDRSLSTELRSQSLPGELHRLRIEGPQEILQRGSPQRTAERGHGSRRGPFTQRSLMQHSVRGRQAQAMDTHGPMVQSQPATSGLQRYGVQSSFHRGNTPPRGPYSGSENRWPPVAPSGTAASSYSSSSGSSRSGPRRASWNSSNESRVVERHRRGSSQVSSPRQSFSSMDGAGSSSGGNVSSASQGTRPEYARQPNVKVNHFELKIQGKIVVYRYRVEIMEVDNDGQPLGESEDIWTSKKLRIFKEFARNELHNHHPIFDGQECFYSTIDLGLDQMEFVNESESNDGRRYKVRIHDKKKQEHSGHGTSLTSEFVQVLDVAIRCALSKKRKRIGRLLLHEEVDDHLVKIFGQQGLQPYRGILTSVRPGQSAMFLNVDTLLTGFYKTCPLTDLLPSSGNAGNTIDWQLDKDDMAFLKSLKGCKVEVKHLPYKRVRTIESITTKTAKEQELEEPSGSTRENKDRKIVAKNIAEYFNRYGGLRYPNLPCVKVTSRRTCYYPLEMCFLQWGQKGTSKLPGQLARPKERFELAEKVVKELNVKPSEYLDPFIERIVPEPVQTGYKIVSTSQTSRTMQVEGEVKWMIVNMCTESNHIGALLTGLVSRGAEMGVDMLAAKDVKIRAASTIDENLIKYLKAADFKLVLFILDSKNSDHYPHIKYLAEIKYGLQTQCVVYDKRITTPSFQKNVIRKIKAKLGYVDKAMPATINEFVFKDVLVMGADVSHHSPNDSKPSVAAIVASIDDRASRYVAVIRPQEKANDKKRVEIILYMKSVVEELFGHYKKENPGKIPKHILLYRDGVSEGEFEKVRTHELADLQSACTEVFQCIPQITFLTVQKRHRTRFMRGHDSNVPPGTVVETTITRPADNEFFLCSHTPIQGTARPAHYRVIADDYGFKPETLQKITFSLCHMYARCVTPVSIPAPVYYAHLAAARASCYMKVTQVDTNPIIIEKDLRDQMFFI